MTSSIPTASIDAKNPDALVQVEACSSDNCQVLENVQPVAAQSEADLPWVVVPPQPAVLLRASGGSRSVPALNNMAKNPAPLLQAGGSLRSLTEGKSVPVGDSNGKGKGKTQRRSATFVVPKEGVLCRKPSPSPKPSGKQEQVGKSKSPKAPSPRSRAVASQHTAACKGPTTATDSQQASDMPPPGAKPSQGKGKGRSHRRSATLGFSAEASEPWKIATDADAIEQKAPEKLDEDGIEGKFRPLAEQLFNQSPDSCGVQSPSTPKKTFPPVPPFKEKQALEPWLFLRQTELTTPRQEDNYEISDQGDSDPDDRAEERRRAKKHVPRWCDNYLEQLSRQADMDPDTVFGNKVPTCDVEEIFPVELYKTVGKERPKRNRGSSQNWGKDKLTTNEVQEYKRKMGQNKAWMANAENLPPATQQLLEGPVRAA
jgi:hypothetical protein